MDAFTQNAYRRLLERVGLTEGAAGGAVRFIGADPVIASRLRYGAATAAALAAQATAVAALWRLRGGPGQDIEVDLARAVHVGLRTVQSLRQNGRGFRVGAAVMGRPRENNFFRTRDGRHIYLLRNTGRLNITTDLVGFLKCANTAEEIGAAAARWDAFALEEALAERKLPAVVARSPAEWLAHPQGRWLAERPGVEVEKIGDSAPEPLPPAPRPLSGIRVLDASHVIAGPATGRMFAEHGAQVLHVTTPNEPEHLQIIMDCGFGKRAAYIDLDQVEDVAQLRRLALSADIFLQSWRPGALARRGFGPEDLMAIRPGIIVVSLSCYGQEGPWAARGGYEPIGQSVSGLSVTEGSMEAPRNAPTTTMNDYLTAYLAAAGALAALHRRAREGGSYHVKTSLAQSSMWVLAQGTVADEVVAAGVPDYVPGPGVLATMASVYGELRYATPIAQLSQTPAFWATPPQPAGASPAQWW